MSNPDDWRAEALDRSEAILQQIGGSKDEEPLETVMDEWDGILQAYQTPELLPLLDDVYEEAQTNPGYNFAAHLSFRLMEWADEKLLRLEERNETASEKAVSIQTIFRAAFEYLEAMELHFRTVQRELEEDS